MKIVATNKKQPWKMQATCAGRGQESGCRLLLELELSDLFITESEGRCPESAEWYQTFVTFRCASCGVMSNLAAKEAARARKSCTDSGVCLLDYDIWLKNKKKRYLLSSLSPCVIHDTHTGASWTLTEHAMAAPDACEVALTVAERESIERIGSRMVAALNSLPSIHLV